MTKRIKTTEDGAIEVNKNGMMSIDGVFAGSDIRQGTTTVIEALSAGKGLRGQFMSISRDEAQLFKRELLNVIRVRSYEIQSYYRTG